MVLVLGDVIKDVYRFVDITTSPEGAFKYIVRKEIEDLGGAFNVWWVLNNIYNFETSSIYIPKKLDEKVRYFSMNGSYLFRVDKPHREDIDFSFYNDYDNTDYLVSDYDKYGVYKYIPKFIERGRRVFINGKPQNISYYKGVYYLQFNKKELDSVYNVGSLEEKVVMLSQQYDIETIAITLGDRGALFYDGKKFYYQPQNYHPKKFYNTIGCGDVWFASFYYNAFVKHLSIEEAMDNANKLSSKNIEYIGVLRHELEKIKDIGDGKSRIYWKEFIKIPKNDWLRGIWN